MFPLSISCNSSKPVLFEYCPQMRQQWSKSQKESMRLAEAGMSSDVLDSAFSVLILVTIFITLRNTVSQSELN